MEDLEKELIQNMRFYGELRFKQLALYLAWITIAVAGISQYGSTIIFHNTPLKLLVSFASMFITFIIWTMEISSTLYWVVHREKQNSDKKWPKPDFKFKIINSTNAIICFYTVNYLFWLFTAFIWEGHFIFLIIYTILFIFQVINTGLNYWSLWSNKKTK